MNSDLGQLTKIAIGEILTLFGLPGIDLSQTLTGTPLNPWASSRPLRARKPPIRRTEPNEIVNTAIATN